MCTDLHRYWISEYVFKAGVKNSDGLLTYEEFKAAVASFGQQQRQEARQDPAAIDRDTLRMLHDYLSENEDVLKKLPLMDLPLMPGVSWICRVLVLATYEMIIKECSPAGRLDVSQLTALVQNIPGLTSSEQVTITGEEIGRLS